MHSFIMNAYSLLIRSIGCISIHIDNKKKKQLLTYLMIFILCVLGIIRPFKESLKDILHYTDSAAVITGTIALLILLIASADKYADYKRIYINRPCLYGWMLCFAMAFIMAFINPVRTGYFAWSIISLFISIPFVMIWAVRDDYLQFCTLLARIMMIAAGCFVIINLLLVPFLKPSEFQCYTGLMGNPNPNGMICVGMYAACFFLLLTESKGILAFSALAGFFIALSCVSDCRTAQIAIALESIIGAGYYLRYLKNKGKTFNVNRIMMICAVAVVTAFAAGFILMKIERIDLNAYAYDNTAVVVSEEKITELLDTLDAKSSGRVRIWKEFISEVTFWGNGSPEAPLISGYAASIYAHNNAIEILYTSGVIAFMGYLVFLICGIVFVIRCLSGKNGWKKEYALVMMAFTGYFVEAMLEIVMYSECHMPAILLNLCMMPIFINHGKEPDQSGHQHV